MSAMPHADGPALTIVGGQPVAMRTASQVDRPQGIAVLLRKAAHDPALCDSLLRDRVAGAIASGVLMTPSELDAIQSTSDSVLRAMIDAVAQHPVEPTA